VKLLQTHPDADLIYSDEDKLGEDGFEAPLFKPDWSPDFFLSYNYVGHLTAVRRDIVQKAGGFRSQFDSAQDYDLFFRVIEQAKRIHHIPRILYHWRRSERSEFIISLESCIIGGDPKAPARSAFVKNRNNSKRRGSRLKIT